VPGGREFGEQPVVKEQSRGIYSSVGIATSTFACKHGYIPYRIISSTNFNAQFNNNMYVTLSSSTGFGT